MAIIRISESESWSAAKWVFENVLEGVISLSTQDNKLKELLENSLNDGSNYLDLMKLDAKEIICFHENLSEFYVISKNAGTASFNSPEFFDAFISKLDELCILVGDKFPLNKNR